MRNFLIAAAVVAVIASTAVYAFEIQLTDQEKATCKAEGGCFLMSVAMMQQLLAKAGAEGCKGTI